MSPIDKGELLTITLLEKQRFVASRVVGKYRLGLQVVVDDGMIPISDSLVDDDNQPVPAFLEMDVYYKPPIPPSRAKELEVGTHAALDPPGKARLSAPAIPKEVQAGPSRELTLDPNAKTPTPDYDDTGLEDLQRNFANLERILQSTDTIIDMDAYVEDEIPRSRKIKAVGKRLLRRGLSVSAEKIPVRERNTKRVSTFKSMRSFIGLGKNRLQDSSGDEEYGLLESLPGPSSEPDIVYSQLRSSMSSDEPLLDPPSPVETPKTKKMYVIILYQYI
ncbi:uncharacterized protein LOC125062588 [Pieris napi]|uniref:uncharacterized protein LOC125062588 n=1 Tax=Pieris napi TaxID=78633 RepID=UPI001FBA5D60|nr:uncharacterized protein LOC125062588 [Pieris napi]